MPHIKLKPVQECSSLTSKMKETCLAAGWADLSDILFYTPLQFKEILPFNNTLVPGVHYQAIFKLDSFVNKRSQRGLPYTLLKLSHKLGSFQGFCFSRAKFIQGIIRTAKFVKVEFSTVNNYSEWNRGVVIRKLSSAPDPEIVFEKKLELFYPKLNSKIDSKFLRSLHARLKADEYILDLNGLVPPDKEIGNKLDLFYLHHPTNELDFETAQRNLIRLKVYLNTALQKYISVLNTEHKYAFAPKLDLPWLQEAVKKLPYQLTKSQKAAIWEILKDVTSGWKNAESESVNNS